MAETLATGTVRGTKGRVAVLENNGSVYAVDLRQLVGYELTDGGTDRDLQSSLGAFG
ncbi:unknown [Haloarcula marismortui ATCC 43049]|nr:unknown [Haloarcula marismortui ATCC 43049]